MSIITHIENPVQLTGTCGTVVETIHRALTIADYVHRLTHEGKIWRLAYRWDALAAGATAGLLLDTPQQGNLDLTWDTGSDGLCTIDLFEQPTVTALGTPLWEAGVFCNKDRETGLPLEAAHTYPAGMGAYIDPTIASPGRVLVQQIMGGTAWKASTPGEAAGIPWVTLKGMHYYFRVINTTQAAVYVVMRFLCVICERSS